MDWVKAARGGREDAFLKLFDEHHLPLFRFAYRITGSVADAEDVVQECFLELLRPECRYNADRTPLRTYLFGVVRNQSLKRLSKRVPATEDFAEARCEGSPQSYVLQAEIEEVVARAIGQLPEGQKDALILSHYEQMPLAEIASVMGIEVAAVKSRLQRARAHLKETLAAWAPNPERRR
jgi:RNA polymerase sigma-70 factor, ECF subfamily